jgi:hypothetical protein
MQNFEIVIVDDKTQLEALGKIPAEMSEEFLRENYAQLSFSEAELSIKKTGMLASSFPRAWTNRQVSAHFSWRICAGNSIVAGCPL